MLVCFGVCYCVMLHAACVDMLRALLYAVVCHYCMLTRVVVCYVLLRVVLCYVVLCCV